jgi:hypothetical protein
MIQRTSNPRTVTRKEETASLDPFKGMDLFKPDAAHLSGESILLENVTIWNGGYLTTRPAYRGIASLLGDGAAATAQVIASTWWRDMLATVEVDNSAATRTFELRLWSPTRDTLGLSAFTEVAVAGTAHVQSRDDADYTRATLLSEGDRLYCFGGSESCLIDADGLASRLVGLPGPRITDIDVGIGGAGSDGTYQVGIEAVRIVDNADVLSSSPHRSLWEATPVAAPDYVEWGGTEDALVTISGTARVKSVTVMFHKELLDNASWTHLRLYRSKRTDPDANGNVAGLREGLYPIGLWPRGSGLLPGGTITFSFIAPGPATTSWSTDADLKLSNWGGVFTQFPYLDMEPFPSLPVTISHAGRLWGALDADTVIYSLPEGDQYREQYDAINRLPLLKGNGEDIRGLAGLGTDLVAFKESSSSYLPSSNPDQGWQTISDGDGMGPLGLLVNLPGIGLLVSTNHGDQLRILTPGLAWSYNIGGQDISRRILPDWARLAKIGRDTYGVAPLAVVWKDRCLITATDKVYVLHFSEGLGFTEWGAPNIPSAIAVDPSTEDLVVVERFNKALAYTFSGEERPTVDTLLSSDPETGELVTGSQAILWRVSPAPLQDMGGSAVLELRQLALQMHHRPATAGALPKMGVASTNSTNAWLLPSQDFLEKDYTPDSLSALYPENVVQWAWFPALGDPPSHIWGDRLFFTLSGDGWLLLTGWAVQFWNQDNRRTGWSAEDRNRGSLWADYAFGLRHHWTRPDMAVDRFFPEDLPPERTFYLLFSGGEGPTLVPEMAGVSPSTLRENDPHLWPAPSASEVEDAILMDGGLGVIDPDEYQLRQGGYPSGGTGVLNV